MIRRAVRLTRRVFFRFQDPFGKLTVHSAIVCCAVMTISDVASEAVRSNHLSLMQMLRWTRIPAAAAAATAVGEERM